MCGPNYRLITKINLTDITRKEARDSTHITPGRSNNWTFLLGIWRLQDSVTESTSSMTRSDHNGFGILKSSWQGFFRFITRNFSSSSDSSPHIRSFSEFFRKLGLFWRGASLPAVRITSTGVPSVGGD